MVLVHAMSILMLILIGVVAFVINIPFGILRIKTRKFSFGWLLCIHLPVIAVIFLRKFSGFSYTVIPYTLAISFLGQFLGVKAGKWWFSS